MMKKLFTIILATLFLALTASTALAYHDYGYNYGYNNYARPVYYDYGQSYNQGYQSYYYNNPSRYRTSDYEDYFDSRSYLREDHYRNYIANTQYDPYVNYFGYMSPYRGPLFKSYGNTQYLAPPGTYETTGPKAANPFYGHSYVRTYHCHGASACHYHNVFPSSN